MLHDCARPAAGSAGAARAPDCGLSVWVTRSCAPQHGGAAAQAAIVVDHAETAHQAGPRVLDLGAESLAGELAHAFRHAEIAAGGAGLPDRQLSAAGVERQRAADRECVAPHEVRALTFRTEAQVLEL